MVVNLDIKLVMKQGDEFRKGNGFEQKMPLRIKLLRRKNI